MKRYLLLLAVFFCLFSLPLSISASSLKVLDNSGIAKYLQTTGECTKQDPCKVIYDVFIQDQHTEVVDLLLGNVLDTVTVLNQQAIDDTDVDVETTGTTPIVGNYICLKENLAFNQTQIITVTPIAGNQYTLGLDTPLDYAFGTASGCSILSVNLAVDGSTTPVEFRITPGGLNPATQWDVTRIMGSMTHTSIPDDGTFGGIAALTKGIYFRIENGIIKNGFNAKTNGDLALRMFDVTYPPAAPAGFKGTRFRRSINGQDKNGVVLRLDGAVDPNDAGVLKIVIQDDLTGLNSFIVVVQGHVVDQN